jgi:hypothetical protein
MPFEQRIKKGCQEPRDLRPNIVARLDYLAEGARRRLGGGPRSEIGHPIMGKGSF